MKQTAVEWLIEKIGIATNDSYYIEMIEQAKEMEKWQRMKFEIPELTDKEIEEGLCGKVYDFYNDVHYNLVEGAKWYREQLKQKQ